MVVGSISAVTCVLYFVPFILRIAGFAIAIWDFILFVLWIALFGVFGKVCFAHQVAYRSRSTTLLADHHTCRCTSMKMPKATKASDA